MGKWNNTDEPIGYLITFRTYGTWLHGDERGSIDKLHNVFGGPRAPVSPSREAIHRDRLRSPPFILNAAARKEVEDAIREMFQFRIWELTALNVRTNHVHFVTGANAAPGRILGSTKAAATRRLREKRLWFHEHSPWVDKGSKRYLWTDEHVMSAVDYVVNGQGGPLPEFD